jgi:hypothetical protein
MDTETLENPRMLGFSSEVMIRHRERREHGKACA